MIEWERKESRPKLQQSKQNMTCTAYSKWRVGACIVVQCFKLWPVMPKETLKDVDLSTECLLSNPVPC